MKAPSLVLFPATRLLPNEFTTAPPRAPAAVALLVTLELPTRIRACGPLASKPHPRLWGTFPRVLGHYVRELGLMALETAIHKMTGRTAMVFGIADRGAITPGAFADLVLLDAATVKDRSTWEDPIQPADGILETWVNGQSAYVHGAGVTGARAGRLLRRAA